MSEWAVGSEETGCSDGTGKVHQGKVLLAVTDGPSSDTLGSHSYLACHAKQTGWQVEHSQMSKWTQFGY
ncbi:hypothetical protein E2C01_020620 [Portunus trituberculatus]|uniref:Uncharacterized protein n=1 Tax=Portunus trituberculatus TaxID=210409 RepID=A0A5B7E0M4_PORTR|nr:hypothetical protein [Portunus trituberculatus]